MHAVYVVLVMLYCTYYGSHPIIGGHDPHGNINLIGKCKDTNYRHSLWDAASKLPGSFQKHPSPPNMG